MNPDTTPLPPRSDHAVRPTRPVPLDTPPAAPAPPSLPLAAAGLLMWAAGTLLAAAVAFWVAPLFGAAAQAWPAALGAALGVAAAGVPLAWLASRLARDFAPAGRPGQAAAPQAGMARELFLELAQREFARARRYGTGAALLLVEVDRHARLRQTRGPNAGDAVLVELLRQTAPTLRTADVLTQFSGSQMAVFLAHADATGALDVAERIRERAEQLETPFEGVGINGQRPRVTVSAGVAHLRPAHLNLQAMLDDAQDATTAARSAGGNCVRAAPVDPAALGRPGVWRERRAQPKQQQPRPDGSA
jgi:diguanylate cyclase (GGDEF)-like protein